MRIPFVALVCLLLSACASEELASQPPPGVDFSGRWKLNEADSDDPMHLVQAQNAAPSDSQNSPTGQGRRGRRGGGGGGFGGAPGGPPMPGMGEMAEGLRWPGKDVEIKQIGGVVTVISAGITQVCQPPVSGKPRHRRGPPGGDDQGLSRSRDMPARDRGEGPPPSCGWDERTLVVQSRDPDEDGPLVAKRYSLSEDGQRLIEVVGFKGGRSRGFSMSRVWDRAPAATAAPSAPAAPQPAAAK
jgi:hypothetical protein